MATNEQRESIEQALDPMHLALVWTMARTKTIAGVQDYDEESYTSTILGGAAVAAPLLAVFGGHNPADQVTCGFGTFRKSGGAKTPLSETATGSDFCLVVGHDEENAKVAIFQAKKLESNVKSRVLSIRRGPAESAKPHFQMTMLLAFVCRILAQSQAPSFKEFASDATSIAAASRLEKFRSHQVKALVKHIDWVHYVVYQDGEATTLPFNQLDQSCIEAEISRAAQTSHKLTKPRAPFIDTMTEGLSGKGAGWLVLPRTVIKKFLPELIEMGAIVVVDDKGGTGLTPDFDCINQASLEPIGGIQANPQGAAAVVAMVSRPSGGPKSGM
ncbi:hypothetical protein KX924_12480 [Streptomyces sp. II-2-2-2]